MKLGFLKTTITATAVFIGFSAQASVIQGKVVSVFDGDTVTVVDSEKNKHRIRLAQIDAPEQKQPFGPAARKHVSQLLLGKEVEAHIQEIDSKGNQLGTIYLDGENINMQIIDAGYAWAFDTNISNSAYSINQIQAKEAGVGLWADKNPIPPWEWRKQETEKRQNAKWLKSQQQD